MKYLLLASFMFACPMISYAVEYSFGGQHRVRGVYYYQDLESMFTQRLKLNGVFQPNEKFESYFWLLTNYHWGANTLDMLRIYGYGDWKITDELLLRIGRTPYELANNSTTMGTNEYERYPYVFDGILFSYYTENITLDVLGVFLPGVMDGSYERYKYRAMTGFSLNVSSLPEHFRSAYLFGMYVFSNNEVDLCVPKFSAEALAVQGQNVGPPCEAVTDTRQQQDNLLPEDWSHVRAGIGIEGDVFIADYIFNVITHGPDFKNISDYELAVDFVLSHTTDFDLKFYLGGHYESDGYQAFYYERHGQNGLLDVVQWGEGTKYGKAGIKYVLRDNIEVGVEGVYFHTISKWGQWGNAGKNPRTGNDLSDKNVFELELCVKKYYAGGFAIELHGGVFDLVKEPYWQAQLNTTFDF